MQGRRARRESEERREREEREGGERGRREREEREGGAQVSGTEEVSDPRKARQAVGVVCPVV
jgi:hypothetical protein